MSSSSRKVPAAAISRNMPPFCLAELGQALLSVQLQNLQLAGGHISSQAVAHRVGRVGGNQQERAVRGQRGEAQRGSRGAGGFAHTALAAEQQKLEARFDEER